MSNNKYDFNVLYNSFLSMYFSNPINHKLAYTNSNEYVELIKTLPESVQKNIVFISKPRIIQNIINSFFLLVLITNPIGWIILIFIRILDLDNHKEKARIKLIVQSDTFKDQVNFLRDILNNKTY